MRAVKDLQWQTVMLSMMKPKEHWLKLHFIEPLRSLHEIHPFGHSTIMQNRNVFTNKWIMLKVCPLHNFFASLISN